ncbi:hypothetical protein SCHPADRAFT_204068 [Schizopora paradoxa]|uniref:F-box domain-containing protein n=1 Tax=Schizopora paradoxa TaxID=27342 RepID=A0A0H2RY58_9AGAM|nr:hypothetical protein SCHPADRAFT_204068 [Schizopora paradoxa]
MNIEKKPNIPPELLDRIFKQCERIFKDKTSGPTFAPNSRLHPLLFVCKEWHDVAERRLYASISLGSIRAVRDRNGRKLNIHSKDVCRRLCATLRKSPRLTSLVRELRLGALTCDSHESENYICLLGICKNIESLDLRGCARGLTTDMKSALAELDLVSLKLSAYGLEDLYTGDRFMFPSELFDLFQEWPRLESVEASLLGDDWQEIVMDRDARPPMPIVKWHSMSLREVTVNYSHLKPAEIYLLADVAPKLETLKIMAGVECNEALQHCLQIWSSTLRKLDIYFLSDARRRNVGVNWRSACPAIGSPLHELRELRVLSPTTPPDSLIFLPKLQALTYSGELPDGLKLARIIQEGKLPCLRELGATFSRARFKDDEEFPPEDTRNGVSFETVKEEIAKACERRHIHLRNPSPATAVKEPDSPQSVDNDWPEPDPWGTKGGERKYFSSDSSDSDEEEEEEEEEEETALVASSLSSGGA